MLIDVGSGGGVDQGFSTVMWLLFRTLSAFVARSYVARTFESDRRTVGQSPWSSYATENETVHTHAR